MPKVTERAPFVDVVREAVEVERALRALDQFPGNKLSANAYLRDALAAARTTREKVTALRRALDADPGRFPATRHFIRRVRNEIIPHSANPPKDVTRLRPYGRDEAAGELAAVGSHVLEAFAVAALIETEQHPERFGTADDYHALQARRQTLQERRTLLLQRIEREHTAADLIFTEVPPSLRAEGYVKAAFAISGGEVPIGPGASARLVAWLLGQPDVLRQIGV